MTAVLVAALGTPSAADERGGDCRARDLTQGINVHGPHRFAATTDCRIDNGILRVTVGAAAAVPTLTISAYTPGALLSAATTYDDTTVYDDTTLYFDDIYEHAWTAMGSVVIDSASVSALLTAVRLVRITPEAVTIRLVAPLIADAFVTLRRGEPFVRIQHGSSRVPLVTTGRRIRWSAPLPTGVGHTGRVSEDTPAVNESPRFIAAVTAGGTASGPSFQVNIPSVTSASFVAGVGNTTQARTTPADLHAQAYDASSPRISVEEG